MNTPVVVILFNRPDAVARVIRQLSVAKPSKLFLAADGPRRDRPADVEQCARAREAAESLIDWDCEVYRDYADTNLGCGLRPSSAISWAFESVEEAIILEDDCVPDPTFFRFCDELLLRYRNDERVMHINGFTYEHDPAPLDYSYCFTRFVGCWGWATWRRAWKHFDFSTKLWPLLRDSGTLDAVLEQNPVAIEAFSSIYQRTYEHSNNPPTLPYWDHQWAFACWANSGLGIRPDRNLISNIGEGASATHTADHPLCNTGSVPQDFPLRHPPAVVDDWNRDHKYFHDVILADMNRMLASTRKRSKGMLHRVASGVTRRLQRSLRSKFRNTIAEVET